MPVQSPPLSESSPASAVEFSRFYRADTIGSLGTTVTLEATAAECAALAQRFDLLEIAYLRASLHLRRSQGDGRIRVNGTLEAAVVQSCVVTLEPVPAVVDEHFSALFAAESESMTMRLASGGKAIDIVFSCDGSDEEDPEPLEDGGIDLGELVAQYLSLALDPYPRASGVALVEHREHEDSGKDVISADADQPEAAPNPFAVLARRRRGA